MQFRYGIPNVSLTTKNGNFTWMQVATLRQTIQKHHLSAVIEQNVKHPVSVNCHRTRSSWDFWIYLIGLVWISVNIFYSFNKILKCIQSLKGPARLSRKLDEVILVKYVMFFSIAQCNLKRYYEWNIFLQASHRI